MLSDFEYQPKEEATRPTYTCLLAGAKGPLRIIVSEADVSLRAETPSTQQSTLDFK